MAILPRSFYDRDTQEVARDLIGKIIVCKMGSDEFKGIISETEAYRSDDPACHAHRGKTEGNSALFGAVGHTYVYLCYGLHHCLNLVSRDTKNFPAGGVLIRAVIWVGQKESQLISGPGRVAKALTIDRSHIGIDVTSRRSKIVVLDGDPVDDSCVQITGRIGLSVAQHVPWRFVLRKSCVAQFSVS